MPEQEKVSLPENSRAVWLLAAAVTVVLLAFSGRYGPHRDELYFVVAGHHPQWGYPDQPPITPLLAAAAAWVSHSLFALRLIPALIAGFVVLISAGIARELGGERPAQLLTALAMMLGTGVLTLGHLLSTATTDFFFDTAVIWLVIRVLHRDIPRGWLLVGLVAGIGLENKDLVAALLAALVLGIVLTPSLRHHLRSPWAWAGAAVAALIWLPDLLWQAHHGWPQRTLAGQIRDEYGGAGGIAQLVLLQIILISFPGFVLICIGLKNLLRRQEWAFGRPVAIAYLALLILYVVSGGKFYYLVGLLGPLLAAGAVVVVQGWSARRLTRFTVALVLLSLFPLPAALPLLSSQMFNDTFYSGLNDDALETIGWPLEVGQVRTVLAGLPPADRDDAVVVTTNYGEAGALTWYGVKAPVYSGHNGFADWGPPTRPGPVVYVGEDAPAADELTGCRRVATVNTRVDNEEDGHGIWACTGPTGGWAQAWPRIRHLNA
jgi:4-amino-4-deoxy-L-arabinose transferase-like glycosyltransferase